MLRERERESEWCRGTRLRNDAKIRMCKSHRWVDTTAPRDTENRQNGRFSKGTQRCVSMNVKKKKKRNNAAFDLTWNLGSRSLEFHNFLHIWDTKWEKKKPKKTWTPAWTLVYCFLHSSTKSSVKQRSKCFNNLIKSKVYMWYFYTVDSRLRVI